MSNCNVLRANRDLTDVAGTLSESRFLGGVSIKLLKGGPEALRTCFGAKTTSWLKLTAGLSVKAPRNGSLLLFGSFVASYSYLILEANI